MVNDTTGQDEALEQVDGERNGRLWVTKKKPAATSEELDRLDEFHRSMADSPDWDRWFWEGPDDAYSAAERLYFVLAPDHDGDRKEARNFWEFVARPYEMDDITPSFVEGFVIGALEASNEMATSE